MLPERDTIRHIREAVADGRFGKTFRATEVNQVLKIEFAGVFLQKHRVWPSGGFTELFVRINPGLYIPK